MSSSQNRKFVSMLQNDYISNRNYVNINYLFTDILKETQKNLQLCENLINPKKSWTYLKYVATGKI